MTTTATIHTNKGDIRITLFADQAPKTVRNFTGTGEKTFSFTADIASRFRLITSMGCQCRPASIIRPRHGKRGRSSIDAARSRRSG